MAGVFSLTNSSARLDQAINAVHSGLFPNSSGVIYSTGNQTVTGNKTFASQLVADGLFKASGSVSGELSPHSNGLVPLGSPTKRFGMAYATGFSGDNAHFNGNVTILGSLNANINIAATGLSAITVTGTGFFENIRVTGESSFGGTSTFSGASNFSGNNNFSGQNVFGSTVSFKSSVFFEAGQNVSGAANFRGGLIAHSGVTATGAFSHEGRATLTGDFFHDGTIRQTGNSFLIGNLSVGGSTNLTGDFTVNGGAVLVKGSTFFTTGSSPADRLGINQNVDQTGDYNLTGSLRVSSQAYFTGGATFKGTSFFETQRISGDLFQSGSSTFTGTQTVTGNSTVVGNANISGSTRISGNLTVVGNTGNSVSFETFVKPYVVASGIGTSRIDTLTMSNFWNGGIAVAPGTGIWITAYSGRIGEQALLLTGCSTSAAHNNDLPTGTYGRVITLTCAGMRNGSGVWHPRL